jgi:arylsulfatase A-like enzyme/Flp pilus assembly protein TadD
MTLLVVPVLTLPPFRFLRSFPTALVLATLVASSGPGCRRSEPEAPARPVPRHLILVTIDTLRADRLGSYGGPVATPNLDRIAAEGVRVVDATVHVPLTRPSHASLFTGRYPARHGLRDNISLPLADDIPTLPERLASAGFTTGAFVSSVVLSEQSGLNRGFGHYDAELEGRDGGAIFLNTLQRDGDRTVERVDAWLKAQAPVGERRVALWVHLYDPHDPYEPPEPYRSRFADRPYDGEVAWTDEIVGRLRARLEAAGLWNDALLVVTSDHGESLGEHDETGHGFFAYETTLRVPLIVRGPGVGSGTTVDGTVRTVDLLPTLVELLGLDMPPGPALDGQSVAAALAGTGPVARVASYAESLTPLLHFGWSDIRVMRDGRWKYILTPRPELYDVSADPDELVNLVETEAPRARALRASLEEELTRERDGEGGRASVQDIPPDLLQKLGALGYVSLGRSGEPTASGADPKDRIHDFRRLNGLMREALVTLRDGDYATSVARLRALRQEEIDSYEVRFYLGQALLGAKRAKEAIPEFTRAIELQPSQGQAHLGLADAHIALGQFTDAVAVLQSGAAEVPTDANLPEREGEAWRRLKRLDEAIRCYERVVSLAPDDALARVRLGELYRDSGATGKAVTLLERAVELAPRQASYWNSLGMILGGAGRLDDAERAFRRAAELDQGHAQYAYNLGLALQRLGSAESTVWFERALERDPSFAPARERLREAGRRRR